MSERLAKIRSELKNHRQEHLLAFYDELDARAQRALLDQIEAIDLDAVDDLARRFAGDGRPHAPPRGLEPAPYYPSRPGDVYDAEHYRDLGRELIAAGQVAAFCVAGGQGTRLGWAGPKGTFPGTVVTGKPLFRVLAEQLMANRNRYRAPIPFYVMTSPLNDAATRSFMQDNNFFGLPRRDLFMFPQGVLPSLEAGTGRLLLADKGTVAVNPDGHGGSLRALAESGALDDLEARGIKHISYVQIDNPMVRVLDPLFIGLHDAAPDSSAEISSKMVVKTDPAEKVGVFCRVNGTTTVIEYTHLPADLAEQRDEDGTLRFRAGSIAVHIIAVEFVRRLNSSDRGFALPLHPARKVVPFIDPGTGQRVEPAEPNAVKVETFVFDAIPLARSSIIYEASRREEFGPIKNASGPDSPATSYQFQSERAAAWLEANGVRVPRDAGGRVAANIEISPLTALEARDLARARLPKAIEPGASIVL